MELFTWGVATIHIGNPTIPFFFCDYCKDCFSSQSLLVGGNIGDNNHGYHSKNIE